MRIWSVSLSLGVFIISEHIISSCHRLPVYACACAHANSIW